MLKFDAKAQEIVKAHTYKLSKTKKKKSSFRSYSC